MLHRAKHMVAFTRQAARLSARKLRPRTCNLAPVQSPTIRINVGRKTLAPVNAKLTRQVISQSLKRLKNSIHSSAYQMRDDEDPMLHSIIQSELNRRNLNITYEQMLELDALKRKISQQLGTFWQELLSNAKGYENLHSGHASGCDLINHKRKHIIELKNKYNTMNAAAYHGVNMKMLKYMEGHPGYTGIIGIINDRTREGRDMVNRYGIRELSGQKLIEFLFADDQQTPTIDDMLTMFHRMKL